MTNPIPERNLISPFLVLFLINAMQVGVGVLGFPRYVAIDVDYDGWIAVILGGFLTSVAIWLIFIILRRGNGDIIEVHKKVYGKWLGGFLSFLILLYLLSLSLVVLRTYIEVVQIWVFAQLETWALSLVFCALAYYTIVKGFRVVTGICFISVILSFLTYVSLFGPLEFMEMRNLLPIVDHTPIEFLKATKTMVLSYLGVKMLLIYYPFIKQPEKALKWAVGGNVLTMIMYLSVSLVAFIYFSPDQLQRTIWPLLSMWQIIEMPFLERFEFIAIPVWSIVVLPNICLGLWSTSRGFRLLFSFNQHQTLIVLLIIVFCLSSMLQTRASIDLLNTVVSETGFYLTYVYLPILWLIQTIRLKGRST
ncbi:spore gernimation protein GerB [Salipaludibacillus keqinensis]|uniref:Spore gernimation protein GerB n=1 Tax=Salipaludibacillus keqinensis TaxID=2045207 RepID=A0A323TIU3_9BACI|nr:GerAB/ArcD/ProY family transporter [Salipaludibacillus keqinensis]PYZ94659.1 spore gernimation protein GerB [Salipaludibacillus keqinensis]